MTTKNESTCADRIQKSLADREEYLLEMMQAIDEGREFDGYDDAYEAFNDFHLGLSVYKTVKIELSTGGPADYIEAVLDDYGDIVKVSYHFADWFDHASLRIPEKTTMHEYVERLLDNGLI